MVDSATDVVTEGATATSGTDLIQTTLTTYTLGANLENLTFTGTGSFTGTGNAVGNVLTGGIGNDVLDGGLGNDTLNGGAGVDTASYASATAGVTVNLGLLTAQNTVGSGTDTLSLIENLRGSGFNDTLTGDGQVNTIIGGVGADSLTGGLGSDIFQFAAGDSGQAATTIDNLVDLVKGALGTGDLIDYATNLTIGGSNAVATGTEASINATTGVATFAAGSGTTLSDALADIATRFTTATNSAGEFALFNVNNTGNYYMFISDGVAGVGANDVVAQLTGITSVSGVDLTGGNLTITG